jgi:hypothetical protein
VENVDVSLLSPLVGRRLTTREQFLPAFSYSCEDTTCGEI